MIAEYLGKLNLPDVMTDTETGCPVTAAGWERHRKTLLGRLAQEEYGILPPAPESIRTELLERRDQAFGGKAVHELHSLTCDTPGGPFTFPFHLILPSECADEVKIFLHVTFSRDVPDAYFPVEEILSEGFGMASFCYEDVVPDKPDGLSEGLAGLFGADQRAGNGCGAIGYWSWAAQRVMDYLQTRPSVDRERIAVVGHSRLGKTALWCAATDERFHLAVSNESGCSGAAITREKAGERVENITGTFPHWFCPNYRKYAGAEDKMPFDQHFLLAAIAPRLLYVASAQGDQWADPQSEFLGCAAASSAYAMHGLHGFITPDAFPVPGTVLQEGEVGYHLREGDHSFMPEDWRKIMDFWKQHGV